MTRFRKTILASALVATSLTASTPAHAYSFGGLFGFFSGWWLDEASVQYVRVPRILAGSNIPAR